MNPKARTANLTIRELPGETVIYDLATMKVHCLNRVALFVWKNSDGMTSVGDLATRLAEELAIPSAYEAVELALEQLSKRGLLETFIPKVSAARKTHRRAILKQLVALAAIPLGRELDRRRALVVVAVDQAGAAGATPRRDVVARQDPDVRRDAERRIDVQQPVGAAVDLQVKLRELPEIKGFLVAQRNSV